MGQVGVKVGLGLSLISIGLLLVVAACYLFRWDAVAALTTFPIWIVAIPGLIIGGIAHLFLSARLGLTSLALWALCILLIADEPRVLLNIGAAKPATGHAGKIKGLAALRVITLNCGSKRNAISVEEIAAFKPDIVCLQEVLSYSEARKLQSALYGEEGHLKVKGSCATLSRYPITDPHAAPGLRNLICYVTLDDGQLIQVVNLHLSSSTTRMDLWSTGAWEDHTRVRKKHREELQTVMQTLENHPVSEDNMPTLIVGDFNSPAGDPIFETLGDHYSDTFADCGKGWANTYHTKFPLLRLDYIFSSPQLFCARSGVERITGSDHRMLITDFGKTDE